MENNHSWQLLPSIKKQRQYQIPSAKKLQRQIKLLILWFALLLVSPPLAAIESFQLELGLLKGKQWQLQAAVLALPINPDSPLIFSAKSLTIKAVPGAIKNIRIHCSNYTLNSVRIDCHRGKASFQHQDFSAKKTNLSFSIPFKQQKTFKILSVKAKAGTLAIDGTLAKKNWSIQIQSTKFHPEKMPQWLQDKLPKLPVDYSTQAKLSLNLKGKNAKIAQIQTTSELKNLNFTDEGSLKVGENINASLKADIKKNKHWQGDIWLTIHAGQMYIDPIFQAFKHPARLQTHFHWHTKKKQLTLSNTQLNQSKIAHIKGNVVLDFVKKLHLKNLDLEIEKALLPAAFTSYLQPFMVENAFAEMKTSGELSAHILYAKKQTQALSLQLKNVSVTSEKHQLKLNGLRSDIDWARTKNPKNSWIQVKSGEYRNLPLGASKVNFVSDADSIRLVDAGEINILDGKLNLTDYTLQGLSSGAVNWQLDAVITPISLYQLTDALKWPPLGGQFAAEIQKVRYANNQLNVDGQLKFQAFNGTVTIDDLRLQSPLDSAPVLDANLQIRGIDLAKLTERFSFGKIQGKLDGEIKNLKLVGWAPVEFDARLYTPHGDQGPHRISQQAIDNLTKVGGGAGSVFTGTFLGLFKEFGYSRLGISCRLRNGICEMRGINVAKNGYYIVEGSGLPRVDVIGYTQNVGWEDLITRLKNIDLSSKPIIE